MDEDDAEDDEDDDKDEDDEQFEDAPSFEGMQKNMSCCIQPVLSDIKSNCRDVVAKRYNIKLLCFL